ncbi:MAG: serine/threonine protein kinase [Coriobacteriia bacterium]|nr:serine/threonine protein kinase [Coriobacteriia bacterium]
MVATRKYSDTALSRETARRDAADALLLQPEELILGRYRPLETLGSGGYGTVFSAWDEQLKRRVAIKEIPLSPADAQTTSKDSLGLAEARTAAMLTHPNIATVYDFVSNHEGAYLIMEYIDGITLADIPSSALNDDTIASLAKSIGSALIHAHKNGVLHLDIKPRNILINHDGRVKIIDFGLALLSGTTGHGSAGGGTIGYMPLEQLRDKPASKETDEWAFAAVMYELCTDECPYANVAGSGASFQQMLHAQETDEPALLETGDAVLDAVFATALSRDAEDRYPGIKKFNEALLDRLGDERIGRKELQSVVEELTDDQTDEDRLEETRLERERAVDRSIVSAKTIWLTIWRIMVGGITATAVYHLFGYYRLSHALGAGAATSDGVPVPLLVGIILGALVGIAPRLGSVLSGLVLALLLGAAGQWAIASIALPICCSWWFFIARKSNAVASIGTLLVCFAVEANFSSSSSLQSLFPHLFRDNLAWMNLFLALAYIVTALVGALSMSRRKEQA